MPVKARAQLLPTPHEADRMTTLVYTKSGPPPTADPTQILREPVDIGDLARDEDAPVAALDELRTQPTRRASVPRGSSLP